MAYQLKITVFNNRDYKQSFTLNGVGGALDLTGCKLTFSISTDEGKTVSFSSSLSTNKCIAITNASAGQVRLTLPYTVLKTLPIGTHNHDLIVTDSTNGRSGVWSGTITVKQGVTP